MKTATRGSSRSSPSRLMITTGSWQALLQTTWPKGSERSATTFYHATAGCPLRHTRSVQADGCGSLKVDRPPKSDPSFGAC